MPIEDLVLYDKNNGGIQPGVELISWDYDNSFGWSSSQWGYFRDPRWSKTYNSLGSFTDSRLAQVLIPDENIANYYKVNVIVSGKSGKSYGPYSGSVSVVSGSEEPYFGASMVVGLNEYRISEITSEGMTGILLYPEEALDPRPSIGSNSCTIEIQKVWLSGPDADPPTKPGYISYPLSVKAGANVQISWGESTDPDGDLAGYYVEKSINNGAAWNQIYQGIENRCSDKIDIGVSTVMYRAKAYDTYGLESDYIIGAVANVIQNTPPTTPVSITVPLNIVTGAEITVSWGASTDAEGDALQYRLERSVDNKGSWDVVATTEENKRYYTGILQPQWTQVAYRVCAIEKNSGVESEYRVSDNRTITSNNPPVVNIEDISGIVSTVFSAPYTVTDQDGGEVSVVEKIDGVVVGRKSGTSPLSESVDVNEDVFVRLTNGTHAITIEAMDDVGAKTIKSVTFTKKITRCIFEPKAPLLPDVGGERIDVCVITVTGTFPSDSTLKVEVTNNANDSSPVWEVLNESEKAGANHMFGNTTARNGFAFSFRITANEGGSNEGGYIVSVQGGFQNAD